MKTINILFKYIILCFSILILVCDLVQAQTTETNETKARAALEAYVLDFWINKDTSAISRALTEDMVYHYLGNTGTSKYSSHIKSLKGFGGAFPDLRATIDVFVVKDEMGAAVTTWEGTQTGKLAGFPPSGRKVLWTVTYVFRMQDDRIAELWEDWNEGGVYYYLKTGKRNVLAQ